MREKKQGVEGLVTTIRRIDAIDEILSAARHKGQLEVEIGSGNGHFLMEYGEKNKESFLIGVEAKKKRCLKILKKIRNRALDNIAVFQEKAEDVLEKLPPLSVDTYHIYFPDPWPKTKHRRRRFFKKTTLDLLWYTMKPGGKLSFATDFFDYSIQAKLLLILHPGFVLLEYPPPEEAFLSVYASKFIEWKQQIYLIGARKV
jgi:tRNA (guanine-N(7)-)-methyltransferase